MKLTRSDLRRIDWKQTLFVDDPHTWRVWRTVSWLLPVGALVLARVVYFLWRLDYAGTH